MEIATCLLYLVLSANKLDESGQWARTALAVGQWVYVAHLQ